MRFWRHVCAALDDVQPDLLTAAQAAFQLPPPTVGTLTAIMSNALSTLTDDVVLVLDDYHTITHTTIHETLVRLLDHTLPRLHLVIATRADPLLPLARLCAQDQLTELRADDLRFTSTEAATFLNPVMGLTLSTEEIAALESRTAGWPTRQPRTRSACGCVLLHNSTTGTPPGRGWAGAITALCSFQRSLYRFFWTVV